MFANVTWPSLELFYRERAWWIIIASVLLEFLILSRSLKTTWRRALGVVLAINLFSALVGMIPCIPWRGFPFGSHGRNLPPLIWAGIDWALRVDDTFSLGSWGVAVVCAGTLSTIFEGLILFTVFRRVTTKWCLLWLPVANFASAELTWLSLMIVSPW